MIRYQIKGVHFYQAELCYADYERTKSIMQGKVDAFKLPDEQYKKVINELYDKGVLADLFQVILKRDEPTTVARILNRWQAKRVGLDFDAVIQSMTGSEVARVVTDFFLCNKAWTTNLLFLANALNSPSRMTFGERLRSSLRKWSISWRGKTSSAASKS